MWLSSAARSNHLLVSRSSASASTITAQYLNRPSQGGKMSVIDQWAVTAVFERPKSLGRHRALAAPPCRYPRHRPGGRAENAGRRRGADWRGLSRRRLWLVSLDGAQQETRRRPPTREIPDGEDPQLRQSRRLRVVPRRDAPVVNIGTVCGVYLTPALHVAISGMLTNTHCT